MLTVWVLWSVLGIQMVRLWLQGSMYPQHTLCRCQGRILSYGTLGHMGGRGFLLGSIQGCTCSLRLFSTLAGRLSFQGMDQALLLLVNNRTQRGIPNSLMIHSLACSSLQYTLCSFHALCTQACKHSPLRFLSWRLLWSTCGME